MPMMEWKSFLKIQQSLLVMAVHRITKNNKQESAFVLFSSMYKFYVYTWQKLKDMKDDDINFVEHSVLIYNKSKIVPKRIQLVGYVLSKQT